MNPGPHLVFNETAAL